MPNIYYQALIPPGEDDQPLFLYCPPLALVTGASGGIGYEIAHLCAANGSGRT
ncbi:hypothetical protein ACIBJC_02520 [Streptomyces sp. NPDC050509]|uniref:hypothetical protein n=1 Tax=Streptomyces sp. NPDC050509 TaxID=3365620 RepID=UPI00378DBC0D